MDFLVDELAEFVLVTRFTDITDTKLLRRNVLDSIACAIAALGGEAVGGTSRASLIGGGATSVDQAALFNSMAVRYVDLLDTYLTPGGLCHPADNFGAILAVAESVGASGEDSLRRWRWPMRCRAGSQPRCR